MLPAPPGRAVPQGVPPASPRIPRSRTPSAEVVEGARSRSFRDLLPRKISGKYDILFFPKIFSKKYFRECQRKDGSKGFRVASHWRVITSARAGGALVCKGLKSVLAAFFATVGYRHLRGNEP